MRILVACEESQAVTIEGTGLKTAENWAVNESIALDRIQQLEAQVPRWIPVEERLPEKYEHVLVATRFSDEGEQDFEIAYYAYERWRKPEGYLYGRVTHWMPLPEPPKEDAQ